MATCHATWAAFFCALFSPLKGSRFSLLAFKLRLKHQQTRPPSDSDDSFHSTHKAHRSTAAVPKINLPRRHIHHHHRHTTARGACCTERLRPLRQRFWHGCEDCIVSSLHSGEHYYCSSPDVPTYLCTARLFRPFVSAFFNCNLRQPLGYFFRISQEKQLEIQTKYANNAQEYIGM